MKIKGKGNYCGEVLGIAQLDYKQPKPFLPGTVVNASTYDFPVRLKIIKGLYDNPFPPVYDKEGNYSPDVQKTINAVKELEEEGVRAIVMACGFFSLLQEVLAEEITTIPVFSSPLLLVPLISRMIGKKRKVGIFTASKKRLTKDFLEPVGIDNSIPYEVVGLDESSEFYACFMGGPKEILDVDLLKKQIVDIATQFVKDNPDIGAFLLECAGLPPFALEIQRATDLPVFDFNTFINCMYQAVIQKEYKGFI